MAEIVPTMGAATSRLTRVPMKEKLERVFETLDKYNLTPKSFMMAFLEDGEESSTVRRRYYGTVQGWDSTLELLQALRDLMCSNIEGQRLWEDFILSEVYVHLCSNRTMMQLGPQLTNDSPQASKIVLSQKPRSGVAPDGAYYNSQKLSLSFFSSEERMARNNALVERMPFLYRLISAKILGDKEHSLKGPNLGAHENPDDNDLDGSLDELANLDGSVFKQNRDPSVRRVMRAETVSEIGSDVLFGDVQR
jgi:hypothetical protein